MKCNLQHVIRRMKNINNLNTLKINLSFQQQAKREGLEYGGWRDAVGGQANPAKGQDERTAPDPKLKKVIEMFLECSSGRAA